jgi:hypothetical protein
MAMNIAVFKSCAGLIISLVFLVLIMARLYCTDGLNRLQVCTLLANVFTLFVGIMLTITDELEDAAKRAGGGFNGSERDIIAAIVSIVNMFVMGLPTISQEIPNLGIFQKKGQSDMRVLNCKNH